jgi:hypothetical protein
MPWPSPGHPLAEASSTSLNSATLPSLSRDTWRTTSVVTGVLVLNVRVVGGRGDSRGCERDVEPVGGREGWCLCMWLCMVGCPCGHPSPPKARRGGKLIWFSVGWAGGWLSCGHGRRLSISVWRVPLPVQCASPSSYHPLARTHACCATVLTWLAFGQEPVTIPHCGHVVCRACVPPAKVRRV